MSTSTTGCTQVIGMKSIESAEVVSVSTAVVATGIAASTAAVPVVRQILDSMTLRLFAAAEVADHAIVRTYHWAQHLGNYLGR